MDLNQLKENPEQIKTLIDLLQSLLPEPQEKNNTTEKTKVDTEQEFNPNIKTKGSRKINPKGYVNKFENMSEFKLHKDDSIIQKQLSKEPPVARIREEVSPIQVTCRICGKKEIVNPSLIFESVNRYKCNNCSTQAG